MRVVFLFRARVSAILRRLSNLNPIAEPKARERERERGEKRKKLLEKNSKKAIKLVQVDRTTVYCKCKEQGQTAHSAGRQKAIAY